MRITWLDREKEYDAPVTVLDVVGDLAPEMRDQVLACFSGGLALELNQTLKSDAVLYPITFQNEEGRRIYERSLRFVLLLAIRRRFPEYRVRIEFSLGFGVFLHLIDIDANEDIRDAVEKEMRAVVVEDLPFVREKWTREKAIRYFGEEGEEDKMRLLAYRPYDYFNVYLCGGMAEYFYGAMLPSTGYVPNFKLILNGDGLVLQMPSPADPLSPAPYIPRPKHFRTFAQSNEWCAILHCTNAADLNDLITSGELTEFIRVNEALHNKSLSDIASEIRDRASRVVFVAGPSSSGKTTFTNRLKIQLRVLGLSPVMISLDDFYLDRDKIPLEADGLPDLEALTALDVPLLNECLEKLVAGETVMMPRFDFKTGKRAAFAPLRVSPDQPLLIEGIHGLNPALSKGMQDVFHVYISELTCLNLDNHNRIRTTDARLLRRIVRDYQFRNTPAEDTLAMWNSVRRGEEKWIFPYQENADVVFNSALHYELPVLKGLAYDLLKCIPPENPHYLASRRLLKILHYMLPAPEEALREIPPLSILREFIGGCTLY